MSTAPLTPQQQNRAVWSVGNWDAVSAFIAPVGPALLDVLDLPAGSRLLDVGTGSGGTVAIPAAQRGLMVTGSDITDAWFADARRRAADAGVEIEWIEGDASDLPFEDDSYDAVTSTFGHMFAPDHAAAARELGRVCRPGGVVGLCCWCPDGKVGRMFGALAAHMPPPPAGFQPPVLWGAEEHVRELLEPLGFEVTCERTSIVMTFESVAAQTEIMGANFGPIVTLRNAVGEEGWPAVQADLRGFIEEMNEATDGTSRATNDYLRTVARMPAG